jgi:transcriptional regulator with XRE-family HTH domain
LPPTVTLTDPALLERSIEQAQLTYPALAAQVGISRNRLWALRSGDKPNVDPAIARRIAAALKVDQRRLFAVTDGEQLADFLPVTSRGANHPNGGH